MEGDYEEGDDGDEVEGIRRRDEVEVDEEEGIRRRDEVERGGMRWRGMRWRG